MREWTYRGISTRMEDLNTALGGEGLRAGDDALSAVDNAPARGELEEVGRGRGVDGRGGQRHVCDDACLAL